MELQEEQREGRNKETTINRTYIESGEYRKKFDLISDNKGLNRLIYNCAKEMLIHRSGTLLEDMYWIDAQKNKVIAKETNQLHNTKITYSKTTRKIIDANPNLITIHTHPYSFPPSIEDLNSNNANKYAIGIVCCHDGKIFIYKSNVYTIPTYYKNEVEDFLKQGYNEYEAQIKALKEMERKFDVAVKEVYL